MVYLTVYSRNRFVSGYLQQNHFMIQHFYKNNEYQTLCLLMTASDLQ